MYLNAPAFFIAYHTLSVILIRRFRTSRIGGGKLSWFSLIVVAALFFAWAEDLCLIVNAAKFQNAVHDMLLEGCRVRFFRSSNVHTHACLL